VLVRLKRMKRWVSDFFLNNDWADKEAEHFFKKDKDESN
jgi:hypothetical protein